MTNPHFDDNRVVWNDRYSGLYEPPDYDEQFELQWHTALSGDAEYFDNPGTSTADEYIYDRVFEWTGVHPQGKDSFNHPTMGSYVLDHPIDPELIRDKDCIDIGAGMGRWTRTLQMLGAATVLSVDVSPSALASTRQFNPNVLKADVVRLADTHSELVGQFDFANLWGVAMHTHDPAQTFASSAAMVKPGGALYLMVYSPEGLHNRPLTQLQRRYFHGLKSVDARLNWVAKIHSRRWNSQYTLKENLLNVSRNLRRLPKGSKLGILDMLEPYYNWVVPLDVIHGWMHKAGFTQVIELNPNQRRRAAHHVLGVKS